jgi:hypothetical protein
MALASEISARIEALVTSQDGGDRVAAASSRSTRSPPCCGATAWASIHCWGRPHFRIPPVA